MDVTDAVVDLEHGTITDVFGLSYQFTWSWSESGDGRGRAALWVGKPNGPCYLEDEFLVKSKSGERWVLWQETKGLSRWRPDRDEDAEGYVPKPDAFVWGALERLILDNKHG